MTVHTSVFHPHAMDLDNADATGKVDGTIPNDPALTSSRVGFVDKDTGKQSFLTAYDMGFPFSGPALPTDGRIIVKKANIEFEIATTAVVDAALGNWKVGIMAFAVPWVTGRSGFSAANYPTLDDLPYPTGADDLIIPGRLYNDTFLDNGVTAELIYGPTNYTAGYTVRAGEGFPGFFFPPFNHIYANRFVNFASELQAWFRRSQFLSPPGGVGHPLGIVIDTLNNPAAADENFILWTRDHGSHNGVVLTIEWEDMKHVVRSSPKAGQRVTAPGSGGGQRVEADYDARGRIFAAGQAGQRVAPVNESAGQRVRAPLSNARNVE